MTAADAGNTPGDRLTLRDYRDEDLASVVALFTAAVHQGTADHYDDAQRAAWAPRPPDLERWRQRLAADQVVLAEAGDDLGGFIGYRDDGYIEFLFTAPSQLRQGVASRLYAAVEARLRTQGATALFTEASRAARPFFLRQGFVVEAEEQVGRNGVTLQRFRMRKLLV